jgi:hypothetical protein
LVKFYNQFKHESVSLQTSIHDTKLPHVDTWKTFRVNYLMDKFQQDIRQLCELAGFEDSVETILKKMKDTAAQQYHLLDLVNNAPGLYVDRARIECLIVDSQKLSELQSSQLGKLQTIATDFEKEMKQSGKKLIETTVSRMMETGTISKSDMERQLMKHLEDKIQDVLLETQRLLLVLPMRVAHMNGYLKKLSDDLLKCLHLRMGVQAKIDMLVEKYSRERKDHQKDYELEGETMLNELNQKFDELYQITDKKKLYLKYRDAMDLYKTIDFGNHVHSNHDRIQKDE